MAEMNAPESLARVLSFDCYYSKLTEPHQRRALMEWIELEKRLRALDAFIPSSQFACMADAERLLLADQKDAMRDYARALSGRLLLWGADVDALRKEMVDA